MTAPDTGGTGGSTAFALHRLRRAGLATVVAAVVSLLLGALAYTATAQAPLKIGIIGAGQIGGTLGEHWVKAGHEVLLSSRHPESLRTLAARLGPRARVGSPGEAAAFGDVVLVSVPYGAFPQIGRDHAEALRGKIVLDPGNPFPQRDGPMAEEARRKGTAAASLGYLGEVRLVRAFNTVPASVLRSQAHRTGERIAVPLASDDPHALEVAARLVRDAGFEPIVVGPLARSKAFDVGTPVFGRGLTAGELRRGLGLER
jgi:predicted dinucleotide-binding enzyme